MSWKNTLKKSIATATRSAELWIMNEEPVHREVLAKIKSLVKSGHDKEEALEQLANWLPSIMIHMEGFMEELERDGKGIRIKERKKFQKVKNTEAVENPHNLDINVLCVEKD